MIMQTSKKVFGKTILTVLIAAIFLQTVACGLSFTISYDKPVRTQTTTAPKQPTENKASIAPKSSAISWRDAANYVGVEVTIQGPVAGTYYASSTSGKPTFLNIGVDYPNDSRFTVLIWGRNRSNFSSAPETLYSGCTIEVTGTVYIYEGLPQIEIVSPDNIEIVK